MPAAPTAKRRDEREGGRRRRRGLGASSAALCFASCAVSPASAAAAASAASAAVWTSGYGSAPPSPPVLLGLAAIAIAALVFLSRLLDFAFRKTPFPLRGRPVKTMVVLGSGGHTAEMLVLMDHMDRSFYAPRVYVSAATDALSAVKAEARERRWAQEEEEEEEDEQKQRQPRGKASQASAADLKTPPPPPQHGQHYKCVSIPRSREVGQPWLSSALTTARATLHAALLVLRERPALLLVNGPGTCVPLVAAAALWRALGLCDARVAYVESVARVRRLSLSARLLRALRLTDVLLVQWPGLAERFPGKGTEYVGRLF